VNVRFDQIRQNRRHERFFAAHPVGEEAAENLVTAFRTWLSPGNAAHFRQPCRIRPQAIPSKNEFFDGLRDSAGLLLQF